MDSLAAGVSRVLGTGRHGVANAEASTKPVGAYTEFTDEQLKLWCMLSKNPSKLLQTATQLLSKCEDLRAEVYEERRLAQSRQKAAVGLWKRGFGNLATAVHNNPLAKQASADTSTAPRTALARNTSTASDSGAGEGTSQQLAQEKAAVEAARAAEAKLGPVGALEAWNILYTYQAKNNTRCACQLPAVRDPDEAESRRTYLMSLPSEKTPPDLDLYMTVLDMVSILDLVEDEEFEADTATRMVENPMRWTCRPRFNRLQGGAGSTPLLQCLIRNSEAAMLVARYILKVYPGLVLDTYRWRPQGESRGLRSPFEGENLLHLCIVKRIPDLLLFIERYVPRGHLKLRFLGTGQTTGRFFAPGSAAYYGQTPISFAAATGAAFWFFLYLVRRLDVNLNIKDQLGNTPLHFSVLNGKNESYRYLRQLGASESSRNDDHLTPLQMAVKLGGRCTQGQVYLDHKDAGEHQLIVRPQLLPISDKNQTMAAFILKLSEEVRWTFGSVQRVKYPVQELLLGDHKNDTAAALHLVCKNVRYGPSLLCPEGSLEFVSGSFSKYIGMFDFVRSIIEESKKPSTDGADLPEEMIFRLPNKPGVEPPPVESIIMLLIAERAWQRFGRNMLFIEMFFYVAYLSLLSFVSMDRISDEPLLVINPRFGNVLDAVLLFMAVFMLMLQALKQTSLKQDLDAKEIQVGVKKAVNVAARGISKTVTRARTALGPRVGGTSLSQVHPFSVLSNMSTRSVNGALGGAGKATGPRQGQQRADKQPSVGFGGKVFGGSVSGASGSRAAGGNAGSAVSSGGAGGGGRSANASAVAVGAGSHAEVNMPRGASGMFDATVDGYAPSAGGGDLESGPLLPPGIGRADPSADRPRRMDSHASTARSDGRSQHGDEEGEGEEEDEGEDGDDENDRDGGFARDLITGRRLAGRSSGGGGGGEMEATLALDGGALGDGIDWVNSLYNAMCIISAILTIVACGIRFYMRVRGWATHPSWVPYDAELLAIATWLGFLYLMYYVRCFRHVGRLVIALIQIVLDDVAKILFIYLLLLLGFTMAFRVLLYADCPPAGCPTQNEEREFWSTLPKGLLTTLMLALGDQRTGAFGAARTQGLARFLSLVYIIVANILVLNVFIATITKTFKDVWAEVQQKQILQRLQVMLYLERILPDSVREHLYSKFLELTIHKSPARGQLSRKRSMQNAAGDLNSMMENDDSTAVAGSVDGGSGSRPQQRRALRFLSMNRMSAGLHKMSEILRTKSFRSDKSNQRWHIYIDQTTLESEQEEKNQRIILGQDLSEMDTYWAETGSQVNHGRAAAKGHKGASLLDGDHPRRRAAKDMKKDMETIKQTLQQYLVDNAHHGITDADTLVVMDVQNDFLEKQDWQHAPCPVNDAGKAVNYINGMISLFDSIGATIFFTQDSHPRGHTSFAGTHGIPIVPGQPYPTRTMWYGLQTLWPDHAVQGSLGSQFVDDLQIPKRAIVVRKGRRKHVDAHSAFFESDRCTSTGLLDLMKKRRAPELNKPPKGIGRIFIVGLAYETCVRYTAEDAVLLVTDADQQHKLGWEKVFVIEEACGYLTKDGRTKARNALEALGVTSVNTQHYSQGVTSPGVSRALNSLHTLSTTADMITGLSGGDPASAGGSYLKASTAANSTVSGDELLSDAEAAAAAAAAAGGSSAASTSAADKPVSEMLAAMLMSGTRATGVRSKSHSRAEYIGSELESDRAGVTRSGRHRVGIPGAVPGEGGSSATKSGRHGAARASDDGETSLHRAISGARKSSKAHRVASSAHRAHFGPELEIGPTGPAAAELEGGPSSPADGASGVVLPGKPAKPALRVDVGGGDSSDGGMFSPRGASDLWSGSGAGGRQEATPPGRQLPEKAVTQPAMERVSSGTDSAPRGLSQASASPSTPLLLPLKSALASSKYVPPPS